MDPLKTLEAALSAIADGYREEASAELRDLADWIDRGGFLPNVEYRAPAWYIGEKE